MTPAEMKLVMWDMFVAGEVSMSDTTAAVRMHLKDSSTSNFDYVLRVHNLSKEDFLHSYKYYEAHPDVQSILIDSLVALNDRLVTSYERKYHYADSIRKKKTDTTTAAKPQPAKDSLKKAASIDTSVLHPAPLFRMKKKHPAQNAQKSRPVE